MILGITPARGGSKGMPKKNIKKICGKPLIAWTIESAKKSKLIDRYVVSTEDTEIFHISRDYGAEVVIRPSELAQDNSSTVEVIKHALDSLDGYIDIDIVVLLQCTSPIRNEGLIDKCIEKFILRDADSLATGFICKNYEYGKYDKRRQDLDGWFYDDGNVYVFDADLIRKGDRYGKKMEKMVISSEENVEIDDEFDFWLAEKILEKRLKQ